MNHCGNNCFTVGKLCIGADHNPRYDARRMVELLIAGLRLHEGTSAAGNL